MTIYGYTPAQIKKALVSAVGFSLMVLTAAVPVMPASYLPFVLAVIGVLTTIGVAVAKNAPAPAEDMVPPAAEQPA